MKWTDEGIVLSTRKLGESSHIVTLLTQSNGRCAGVVKIPRNRSRLNIEAGTIVQATWNARLADHLGQWQMETITSWTARLLPFPPLLAALSSSCTLTNQCLPERHPYPNLYTHLKELIENLVHTPYWTSTYVNYEISLLRNLGFGLDLSACAVTGQKNDLIYISPVTGRSVSRQGGEAWKDRLLPLPQHWIDKTKLLDIAGSLKVTGFFLNRHLAQQQGLPLVRQRLVEMVEKIMPSEPLLLAEMSPIS